MHLGKSWGRIPHASRRAQSPQAYCRHQIGSAEKSSQMDAESLLKGPRSTLAHEGHDQCLPSCFDTPTTSQMPRATTLFNMRCSISLQYYYCNIINSLSNTWGKNCFPTKRGAVLTAPSQKPGISVQNVLFPYDYVYVKLSKT